MTPGFRAAWLRLFRRNPDPFGDVLREQLREAAGSAPIPDREPRFARHPQTERTMFRSLEQRRDG